MNITQAGRFPLNLTNRFVHLLDGENDGLVGKASFCAILHKLNITCDLLLPLLDKVITETKEKINFEKLS